METNVRWVIARTIRGDSKALLASWENRRKWNQWMEINRLAKSGWQSILERRPAEAEATLRSGLLLTVDSPQLADPILKMRQNLCLALLTQGKYSAAEVEFRQTALILFHYRSGHLGKQNLGSLLSAMEPVHDKRAVPLARYGLEQSLECLGEDNPTTKAFRMKLHELERQADSSVSESPDNSVIDLPTVDH